MCSCTHTNIPQHLMWQSKDSCGSQFSPPVWRSQGWHSFSLSHLVTCGACPLAPLFLRQGLMYSRLTQTQYVAEDSSEPLVFLPLLSENRPVAP